MKWQAPETDSTNAAFRRKADVWSLGVVAMQMFLGLNVVEDHPSPQIMLSRLDVSDPFDDFARKVFTVDSKKRPTPFELLPAEFLRTDASIMDDQLSTRAKMHRMSSSGVISPYKRRSRHNSSNVMESMSRYAADFTELGRLGKGGFGEVVKARNKLDGSVYAVKKIKQAPQLLDQVLSEVMVSSTAFSPKLSADRTFWQLAPRLGGLKSPAPDLPIY
jgi:eukaryotic translation initiation factor 2-alpha kinase 4